MDDCLWRPPASSITVIVCSIVFMPTALFSSLPVIVAFFKRKATGVKTEMNLFVLASTIASLFSILVNILRVWHHYLSTKRLDPLSLYPSVAPAFVACHIFWISSQFIAALCIVAILLLYMFDRQATARRLQKTRSTVWYTLAVVAIYLTSFGIGSLTTAVGLSTMLKIKTIVFCVIAVPSAVVSFFLIYISWNDGASTEGRQSTVSISEREIQASGNEALPAGEKNESITVEDKQEPDSRQCDAQFDVSILYKIFVFCVFALMEGLLLFVGGFIDSKKCVALFWMKDIGSILMQCYLATSPILFIALCPCLKAEIILMFWTPKGKVQPNGI
ncbi:uncharacterized protein LOC135684462 [Rhopilema esculentum]|uniref:uncharacterized protein LOC135684462 n=1 Tax=Rhopilema esculentum TaxID=499914 RepID=UPI0031D7F8E0